MQIVNSCANDIELQHTEINMQCPKRKLSLEQVRSIFCMVFVMDVRLAGADAGNQSTTIAVLQHE